MSKKWYVVHAYSGFEKSVQRALLDRIRRAGMEDKFGQILVPVEEVVEMKSGQKSISERKFFPGYVLVEMDMTDESWHLVKNTAKVTGFVGGTATKPTPISEKEVQNILNQIQEGVEKPRPKVRGGARQGWPVCRFSRQCGRRQLRQEQAARVGDDFRPVDTGRTGFRSGRKSLISFFVVNRGEGTACRHPIAPVRRV
jgi:transcription termination/antitermination factor NusG